MIHRPLTLACAVSAIAKPLWVVSCVGVSHGPFMRTQAATPVHREDATALARDFGHTDPHGTRGALGTGRFHGVRGPYASSRRSKPNWNTQMSISKTGRRLGSFCLTRAIRLPLHREQFCD